MHYEKTLSHKTALEHLINIVLELEKGDQQKMTQYTIIAKCCCFLLAFFAVAVAAVVILWLQPVLTGWLADCLAAIFVSLLLELLCKK